MAKLVLSMALVAMAIFAMMAQSMAESGGKSKATGGESEATGGEPKAAGGEPKTAGGEPKMAGGSNGKSPTSVIKGLLDKHGGASDRAGLSGVKSLTAPKSGLDSSAIKGVLGNFGGKKSLFGADFGKRAAGSGVQSLTAPKSGLDTSVVKGL